jgi:hypothetical protein
LRTRNPDDKPRPGEAGLPAPPEDVGLRTAGRLDAGVPGDTTARISTCCSREQIGQFVRRRLWRQKVGTIDQQSSHAGAVAVVADS